MNKKIFLCGFHQETASFNPNPSTIEDYTGYIYQATGEELIAVNRGKNTLLGGMIVRVDGKVIDGSLRHKLQQIKEVMNS